jgi:hypothetical protein
MTETVLYSVCGPIAWFFVCVCVGGGGNLSNGKETFTLQQKTVRIMVGINVAIYV